MDALIDKFAGEGLIGIAAIVAIWLMREQIAGALRPVDRVGPAEMREALVANTAALAVMHADFKANNGLFTQVLAEVSAVAKTLEDIRVETVRGNGAGDRGRR